MRKLILGCICLFLCVSYAHMTGAAADTPPSDLPVLESPLAAGQFHSVVLKRDGTVWVQGFGKFGAPWLGGMPYLVQVMEDATWVGSQTMEGMPSPLAMSCGAGASPTRILPPPGS